MATTDRVYQPMSKRLLAGIKATRHRHPQTPRTPETTGHAALTYLATLAAITAWAVALALLAGG